MHRPSLESSAPPGKKLIWAHGKGGDWERMHGQGPLIYSWSVIMWPALRETEIEIQRNRQTEKAVWERRQKAKCCMRINFYQSTHHLSFLTGPSGGGQVVELSGGSRWVKARCWFKSFEGVEEESLRDKSVMWSLRELSETATIWRKEFVKYMTIPLGFYIHSNKCQIWSEIMQPDNCYSLS